MTQWSIKHRADQERICEKYVLPVIADAACRELTRADFQDVIDQASTASVAHSIRRCRTALLGAGVEEGFLTVGRDLVRGVRWQVDAAAELRPLHVGPRRRGGRLTPRRTAVAVDVPQPPARLRHLGTPRSEDPIEDLSRLLGHSSTRVTQDIYVHVRDDMFERFYEATGSPHRPIGRSYRSSRRHRSRSAVGGAAHGSSCPPLGAAPSQSAKCHAQS